MSDTRIIHQNKDMGITQYWHEHEDGSVTLQTTQNVADIAEDNKRAFNTYDERSSWRGDMHKVASIPMAILHDLQRKGITNDPVAFKKWLNDPENRVFRTRPGKV